MLFEELPAKLRRFADERDWGSFHTPKNLAMALGGEAGELLAVLQWVTSTQLDHETLARVEEELADILIYAVRLADVCEIDLSRAVETKIESNARRYSVAEFRGSAKKAPGEGDS